MEEVKCPACDAVYSGINRQKSLQQHLRRKGTQPGDIHAEHYHPRSAEDRLERQRRYQEKNGEALAYNRRLRYYTKKATEHLLAVKQENLLKSCPSPPIAIDIPEPLVGNPFYIADEFCRQNLGRSKRRMLEVDIAGVSALPKNEVNNSD
jgi:hypothetical protein